MQARYRLDTNVCIYLMKQHPPEVAARFATFYVGEVVISAITLAKLEWGIASMGGGDAAAAKENREALQAFQQDVPVVPFDGSAAVAYGPVRLATRSRTRDALDKLIAAHALALDVTLVTNNLADFVGYPGLRVENWMGCV